MKPTKERLTIKDRFGKTPVAVLIVVVWLLLWSLSAGWAVFFLLLPIYWQVFLKKDLAPAWW